MGFELGYKGKKKRERTREEKTLVKLWTNCVLVKYWGESFLFLDTYS